MRRKLNKARLPICLNLCFPPQWIGLLSYGTLKTSIHKVQYIHLKVVKNMCMTCNGVRCIHLFLHHVMEMVSLMSGTSTKTLKVLLYISMHLKINKVKMDIDNKKKVKHCQL